MIWSVRIALLEFSKIKTEGKPNPKPSSSILMTLYKQTKNKTPPHRGEIQSYTCHRISFHFQAINQGKKQGNKYFELVFSLWRFMLLRSGRGGGGGLGSCLFVPEGPAIFITSSIQFQEPASLGLFRCRIRSISTQPRAFWESEQS